MSEYSFTTESGVIDTDSITLDEAPPTAGVEYPCQVCGREAGPYGGRGRKPKLCPEHKKDSTGKVRVSRNSPAANAKLAGQATDALCQINDIAVVGLTIGTYVNTAAELADKQEVFRERAYAALLTDPELCKSIIRGGAMSGKALLFFAYASMLATVGAEALNETRERRDARALLVGESE